MCILIVLVQCSSSLVYFIFLVTVQAAQLKFNIYDMLNCMLTSESLLLLWCLSAGGRSNSKKVSIDGL